MSGNTPSSIKITALADIGNAISYTTLFPVVSMQGTPTTDKANLQIIGNIILNGAGGSYFPAAAQALLSQSVTNAAQPNITSVGTLTGLSVLANINAGNVNGGNIVNANFYYGDAGHLANINVANVSGLGNVATINLDGNVSNVLSGAGTWVPMTGGGGSSYIIYNGNSNVSIPSTDGSTVITTNSGIAHRWVFDDQGNLTLPSGGQIENNVNSGEVSTTINDVNGVAITTGASVSGNGVFVYSYGETDIYANGHVWAFENDGNFRISDGGILWNNGGLTTLQAGSDGAQIGSWDGQSYVIANSNGTYMQTLADTTNNIWKFGVNGDLTLPGNISNANVISANSFVGDGSQLTNIPTQTTGSWTLDPGTNTVSITVPLNGTYSIWVNGNIPNGIITYTATAVVTNPNMPVLGSSYGWYYEVGNALVLTAIPTQFVGTVNNISNAVVSTTTANVFTFGITNNSGSSQVVNWGYTKL